MISEQRDVQRSRKGFSLLELLVVLGVISLLTAILLPVVTSVTSRARQTKCKSNLRQFAVAINVYRADHRGRNPDWLSNLYPEYIDARELYVCPADRSRGEDGGKPGPQDRYWSQTRDGNAFREVYDNSGAAYGRNPDIHRCSYFYEFNNAPCSFLNNQYTWAEGKLFQLRTGDFPPTAPDPLRPYSESRLPIIRCYHHWDEGEVSARNELGGSYRDAITINVGYAGNIFIAPLQWEHRVDGLE